MGTIFKCVHCFRCRFCNGPVNYESVRDQSAIGALDASMRNALGTFTSMTSANCTVCCSEDRLDVGPESHDDSCALAKDSLFYVTIVVRTLLFVRIPHLHDCTSHDSAMRASWHRR